MRPFNKFPGGKRSHFRTYKHPKGTARVVGATRVRSHLEAHILEDLIERDATFIYEGAGLSYITKHTYTPDFVLKTRLGRLIYVEVKGWFQPRDRTKMIAVAKQHPKADIRFVFDSPHKPIYKGSKTTYAQWATKWKFQWADSRIPKEWTDE